MKGVNAMSQYTANDIALWILSEAEKQRIPITPMKLQKLLYYVQGCNLGMTGDPLFDDAIEAWPHGPVIPSVYRAYQQFGPKEIPFPEGIDIPDEYQSLIASVVNKKGKLSASALRNGTYGEDPWKTTPHCQEIRQEKILEFFSSELWTSDEEDDYQPFFETIDEQKKYLADSFTPDELNAILQSR